MRNWVRMSLRLAPIALRMPISRVRSVTDTQGNTVKVTTSPGSAVTKSVKASAKSIHPGETVVVTGTAGADGAISAESIRVGGGAGGGVPASAVGRTSGKAGGSEPSLFGNGG